VWHKRAKRSHSHKFSGGDTTKKPKAWSRQKIWVGAYLRESGKRIAGYFRRLG
jgi:hypothetical protein